MNIIQSDIIHSKYDNLWQDVSSITGGAAPAPVLILVSKAGYDSQQAQLQKMLEAAKLTPDQYNIVQLGADEQVAWHKLRESLDPGFIFLIGVLPTQLGISALFRLNEPDRFNGRVWLTTLSISELEQRPDVKKQLWISGMKPLFVDKAYGELVSPATH